MVRRYRSKYKKVDPSRRTADGFVFDSIKEMECYLTFVKPSLKEGQRLTIHCKLPLFSQGKMISKAEYINVDFIITEARFRPDTEEDMWWQMVRAIDCKPADKKMYSRDWHRGAAAFEGTYGLTIEEWTGA